MHIKTSLLGAAFALFASATAMANGSLLSEEDHFGGRSTTSIIATLATQGIAATYIEEWGSLIRIDAVDTNGANKVIFVDKDTLRPVGEALAVGTKLSVSTKADGVVRADGIPRSLVETDD